MALVEITAVGALVRPLADDAYRPKIRGDRVELSDADAQRLVADGTAILIEPQEPAENAEDPQPDGGLAIDLNDPNTTIKELRQFADARRIRLTGARTRPEILGMIRAALENPEVGAEVQAAMISPALAETSPIVNPDAAEPGGPADTPQPGDPDMGADALKRDDDGGEDDG